MYINDIKFCYIKISHIEDFRFSIFFFFKEKHDTTQGQYTSLKVSNVSLMLNKKKETKKWIILNSFSQISSDCTKSN